MLESYREAQGNSQRLFSLKEQIAKALRQVEEKIRVRERALEQACQEWDRLVSNPSSSGEAFKEAKLKQASRLRSILDEMTYLKTLLQSIQTGGKVIH